MTNIERLKMALKLITLPDDVELSAILLENGLNDKGEYSEPNKIQIYKTAIDILEDYKTTYIEKGFKTEDITSISPKDYIATIDSTICERPADKSIQDTRDRTRVSDQLI